MKSQDYMLLTCPMNNCPDTEGLFYEVTKKNVEKSFFKEWVWFTSA